MILIRNIRLSLSDRDYKKALLLRAAKKLHIPVSDIHKQCVYKESDNSCFESEKHCYDYSGANKEIC